MLVIVVMIVMMVVIGTSVLISKKMLQKHMAEGNFEHKRDTKHAPSHASLWVSKQGRACLVEVILALFQSTPQKLGTQREATQSLGNALRHKSAIGKTVGALSRTTHAAQRS